MPRLPLYILLLCCTLNVAAKEHIYFNNNGIEKNTTLISFYNDNTFVIGQTKKVSGGLHRYYWGYGTVTKQKDKWVLYDSFFHATITLKDNGRELKVLQGYQWMMDSTFTLDTGSADINGFGELDVNGGRCLYKPLLGKMVRVHDSLRAIPSAIGISRRAEAIRPGTFSAGVSNSSYLLELTAAHQYYVRYDKKVISKGTWSVKEDYLLLSDTQVQQQFYCMIKDKEEVFSVYLPVAMRVFMTWIY